MWYGCHLNKEFCGTVLETKLRHWITQTPPQGVSDRKWADYVKNDESHSITEKCLCQCLILRFSAHLACAWSNNMSNYSKEDWKKPSSLQMNIDCALVGWYSHEGHPQPFTQVGHFSWRNFVGKEHNNNMFGVVQWWWWNPIDIPIFLKVKQILIW